MTEPRWHRTEVPPLRADIDRHLRETRRSLRRIGRIGWFTLTALLGFTVGTLAALQPENFI